MAAYRDEYPTPGNGPLPPNATLESDAHEILKTLSSAHDQVSRMESGAERANEASPDPYGLAETLKSIAVSVGSLVNRLNAIAVRVGRL